MPLEPFDQNLLETSLNAGMVTGESVRFWFRVERGRPVRLVLTMDGSRRVALLPERGLETDHTGAASWPDDFADVPPLAPDTRYEAHLEAEGGDILARCRFRTLPRRGELRFAFASCHEPFDAKGHLDTESIDALEAFAASLRQLDPHVVFLIGDQMYVDAPPSASVFSGEVDPLSMTTAEVRELLHRRYRAFWGVPGWRDILSEFACLPILDDHEVVDNYGASTDHVGDEWRAYRRGAFGAYLDYQGARASSHFRSEGPFSFEVANEDCAVFVADSRSRRLRDDDHPALGAEQKEQIVGFLRDNERAGTLILVFSVPVFHIPDVIATAATRLIPGADDCSDRWDAPHFRSDRDWLLRLLRDHQRRNPAQHLVVVGGDIHVGTIQDVRWCDGSGRFDHLISSSISHRPGEFFRHLSAFVTTRLERVSASDGEELADIAFVGDGPRLSRPYTGLNVGFVTAEPGARPRVELLGWDGQEVSVVQKSGA